MQKCLAMVVTRSPPFSHSLPVLKILQWLPVRYRIIFAQLPIKHFHPSNQHIYIRFSLLQDSLDCFDHLTLIYLLFPVEFSAFYCGQNRFLWSCGFGDSLQFWYICYLVSVRSFQDPSEKFHLKCGYSSFGLGFQGPAFASVCQH